MPKRFDTNPLDPEFPEKARTAAETLPDVEAYREPAPVYIAPPRSPLSTAEFPDRPPSVTEEETQRFSEAHFDAFTFKGNQVPAVYQHSPFAEMNRAGERKVAKTGVPERWLVGLPYLPFWIGIVAGLVLLLVIPKEENKVRFHAAQGFAAQVAIMIVSVLLGVVGSVTDSSFGGTIFWIATTVMMIVFAIRAWKGKPVHIEVIDDLTNWFEEKIGPIKS